MTNEFSQGTKSSVSITDDVIEDAKAAGFYVDGRNIYESESDFLCGVKISKKINRLVELQRQRERQAVAVPVAEMFIATEKVSQAKHINVYGLEGYRQGEEANGLPDGTYNLYLAAPLADTVKQEAVGYVHSLEWQEDQNHMELYREPINPNMKMVFTHPSNDAMRKALEKIAYSTEIQSLTEAMYEARHALANNGDCPRPIVEELTNE
jgi:hypothetical protein